MTNREFLAFVEDGGYRNLRYWSADGWQWLTTGGAPDLEKSFSEFFSKNLKEEGELAEFKRRVDHPIYWRRDANGRWLHRVYDVYVPLEDASPLFANVTGGAGMLASDSGD